MKILTCAAAAVAAALLAASPGTAGKGGPTPDPLVGWDGVVSASGAVRYVALPGARHDDGRRRARQRRARAPLRHGSRAARHPTGHVGRDDGRHLGQRPEARARLDHEPPARSPDDLRRPAGQHARGPAPDRALGPLGVRRDLTRRVDDLRRPVRRPVALQRSRHRHGQRARARGADRRQARARRGDARLADDARLGARPGLGVHALREAERHGVRPRARHEAPRSPSASTFPGQGSGTGSARSGFRSAPTGARSCCASPASGRSPRSISAASR